MKHWPALVCGWAIEIGDNGTAALHSMVAEAFPGPQPSSFVFDYGRVVFLSGTISRKVLTEWLTGGRGEISGRAFSVPSLSQHVSWQRYPSHTKYGYLVAPWPFTQFKVQVDSSSPSRDPALSGAGYLAAEGCPFFPDYKSAALELLFRVTESGQGWDLPREIVDVHVAHPEAWIEHVHFSPTSVTVTIEGAGVAGTRLEVVGSPCPRWNEKPEQPGDYTCPLPNGSPPNLWIILSRGNLRLDYRHVNQLWSPFSPKVENMMSEPPDPGTRLGQLIYLGESETVEFKREIPLRHDTFLKTIAAFANGQGGTMVIGVDKDEDRTIVGVSEPVAAMKDRLTNMIRDSLVPEPRIRLDDVEIDGKHIIAIEVDKGDMPPYGLHADKPVYYVRRGATTFVARQDEVRALGQSSQSSGARPGGVSL
ncbi:MAG: AlbA family DNA-binding domain-containing protein [Coriobacteriia bacterium]